MLIQHLCLLNPKLNQVQSGCPAKNQVKAFIHREIGTRKLETSNQVVLDLNQLKTLIKLLLRLTSSNPNGCLLVKNINDIVTNIFHSQDCHTIRGVGSRDDLQQRP